MHAQLKQQYSSAGQGQPSSQSTTVLPAASSTPGGDQEAGPVRQEKGGSLNRSQLYGIDAALSHHSNGKSNRPMNKFRQEYISKRNGR